MTRWLTPEPLLREPLHVLGEHLSAHATPTYAYARNSPIAYVDPDGLDPLRPPSGPNSPPGNYHGPLPLPEYPSQTPPSGPQLPEYKPPGTPAGPGAQASFPVCSGGCAVVAGGTFALCMAQKQNRTLCRRFMAVAWTTCMVKCLNPPTPNHCQ